MTISTTDYDLAHPLTNRAVPVRRYDPPVPAKAWMIFSVGYGGDRTGYAYAARAWAELGLVVLVAEHVGSNLEILKTFTQKSRQARNEEVVRRVLEPQELQARPQDLALVYHSFKDEFTGLSLGLAGHSYGSYSVLAALGLKSHLLDAPLEVIPAQSLLIMSPQPPGMIFAPEEYLKIGIRTLLLTGTKDHLIDGGENYEQRLGVFDSLPPDKRYLALLEGTEHMTFAGIGLNIAEHLKSIKNLTSKWWQASLLEDRDPRVEDDLKDPLLTELRIPLS